MLVEFLGEGWWDGSGERNTALWFVALTGQAWGRYRVGRDADVSHGTWDCVLSRRILHVLGSLIAHWASDTFPMSAASM